MRGVIWGAVLGAVLLVGCRTDGPVAMRKSPGSDGRIAQNPPFGPRGFSFTGTVEADYSDVLVVKDKWGKHRYLRIREDTRYYQGGKLIGREFLAPGSTVRASFSGNHTELIAREIIILEDVGTADPLQLPDRMNTTP